MKIAICDDEKIFTNQIYKYLWQQPDCFAECFVSPSALLEKYINGERYDVLFLDVMMEPTDGISLAKSIREYDKRIIIVFLTSHLEYAPAGYEVNAFRYLLKPISPNDIFQVLKDIRHEMTDSRKIMFNIPQCELILAAEEILYLETNDKKTTVFCGKDTFEVHKSLNELSVQLPAPFFFRIHRKYIVNLAHVREFDEKQVTLDCGRTLPISRRKSRAFRDSLETYIEGGLY